MLAEECSKAEMKRRVVLTYNLAAGEVPSSHRSRGPTVATPSPGVQSCSDDCALFDAFLTDVHPDIGADPAGLLERLHDDGALRRPESN
jgi:hypothetical protein